MSNLAVRLRVSGGNLFLLKDAVLTEATRLFRQKDFEGAAELYIQALEEGIQIRPERIEDTGDALCNKKYNPKAAYSLYMKSLEKSDELPFPAKISFVISRLCDDRNFDEAANLLVTALEQGSPIATQVIEYTCSDIGSRKGNNPRLAADLYMKVLEILEDEEIKKIRPGSIGFVGRELCIKFKKDKLKDALEIAASLYHAALDKGIEMNNESIQYLGSELCTEVSPEEGARLYEKALEKDVENINPGNIRYVIDALCGGNIEGAASLYKKARDKGIQIRTENKRAICKHLGE